MEYVQMTLDDWVQMKQKLKQELLGVKQSFVRIGYALRKIDDQKLYEQDGYKSIAEFAKAEYGLEPSTTSRFMSINREYSIDGYSEALRPEYAELGRSQLEEMLMLPDGDRQMIQPETPRASIRELKQFNKEAPAMGTADDLRGMVKWFYKDNPDTLREVKNEEFDETTIKRFAEIVNPGGNRSYRKGIFFLMMYENRIAVKKFGEDPKDLTWWEFWQLTRELAEELEQESAGEEPEEKEESNEREEPKESAEAGKEELERRGEESRNEKQKEEIAPAQKSAENQENQEDSQEQPNKNEQESETKIPEREMEIPEAAEEEKQEEQIQIPEVLEKPFGTRKAYLDTLSERDAAQYLAEEYVRNNLTETMLTEPHELERWLLQEVDKDGREGNQ